MEPKLGEASIAKINNLAQSGEADRLDAFPNLKRSSRRKVHQSSNVPYFTLTMKPSFNSTLAYQL
jgi:hypothetical protein